MLEADGNLDANGKQFAGHSHNKYIWPHLHPEKCMQPRKLIGVSL